jgi:beta-glucanase (GH16 family)
MALSFATCRGTGLRLLALVLASLTLYGSAGAVRAEGPPAQIADQLGPVTFDATFRDDETFPNATWDTKWRDWGQGEMARRSQYGVTLSLYADAGMGVDPFRVKDGVLEIKTDRLGPNAVGWKGGYYTGMLTTSPSFRQKYGYFEVEYWAPMEAGRSKGLWPAAWLLADGPHQEIDLNETYGAWPHVNNQTVHGKVRRRDVARGFRSRTADAARGFVRFGALWKPDGTVTFFVNGRSTGQVSVADMNWTEPMFFIVNNNVGKGVVWNGDGPPQRNIQLPNAIYVRHVRAWSLR